MGCDAAIPQVRASKYNLSLDDLLDDTCNKDLFSSLLLGQSYADQENQGAAERLHLSHYLYLSLWEVEEGSFRSFLSSFLLAFFLTLSLSFLMSFSILAFAFPFSQH